MRGSSSAEPSSTQPSPEVLRLTYQELHTTFRTAFDLWIKGTTVLFAVIGAGFGYLLQPPHLAEPHARLLSLVIFLTVPGWYISDAAAFRRYKSLTTDILAAAAAPRHRNLFKR